MTRAGKSRFLAEAFSVETALLPLLLLIHFVEGGVCLERYGVAEKDLLPGIKLSKPELMDAALFKEGTKTLSW